MKPPAAARRQHLLRTARAGVARQGVEAIKALAEIEREWTPEKRDIRYLDERDRRREGSWDD